ncbi:MAG TPA: 4-hydroxythreonine-4-phosphate dehydrogenase PdxA [bacterium]|nr:4-hydroxythreonine-4-phosphate dehydrogenase PdxA [bacterium]
MSKKPLILVTMGDAAGIGPEIIAKLHLFHPVKKKADVLVIGDLFPMLSAQRRVSRKIRIKPVTSIKGLSPERHVINLLDLRQLSLNDWETGAESAAAGAAAYAYINRAVSLLLEKKAAALVTAPVNKHALHLAGVKEPGHTEILAKKAKAKNFAMMLMTGSLKVVLVTIHTSLKSVPALLTTKKIFDKIALVHDSLKKDFRIKNPRIAVLGLNPHAGEKGAFGNEEKLKIIPAVKRAQKLGINASGPYPPDTIFHKIVKGSHDAALCMYHDQGLIPLKLIGFDSGVNFTMGLPFIRTSPDHGTAYDIAGTGKASEASLLSAFNTALMLALNRRAGRR